MSGFVSARSASVSPQSRVETLMEPPHDIDAELDAGGLDLVGGGGTGRAS